MTGDWIAYGFRLSFTSCFREENDRQAAGEKICDILHRSACEKVQSMPSRWEDLSLQAGRLECAAIHDTVDTEDWQKFADAKLEELFIERYPGQCRRGKLPVNGRVMKFSEALTAFENALLGWIAKMTLGDIRKTVNLFDELQFIITTFHSLDSPEYISFFRIVLFLDVLRSSADLSGLRVAQGEVLSQKRLAVDECSGLTIEGKTPEEVALQIAAIRQFHSTFKAMTISLPLNEIFSGIFTSILSGLSCDPSQLSSLHPGQPVVILAAIPGLRWLLKNIEVICDTDETGSLLRVLMHCTCEIRVIDISEVDRIPSIENCLDIVVGSGEIPRFRWQSQEVPATLESLANLQLNEDVNLRKPWTVVRLASARSPNSDIFTMLEKLGAEQILWFLVWIFRDIPSNHFTGNLFLAELIQKMRLFSQQAIRYGEIPIHESLTILGPKLSRAAVSLSRLLARISSENNMTVVDQLLKSKGNEKIVIAHLLKKKQRMAEIVALFEPIGLTLWEGANLNLERILGRVREVEKAAELDAQRQELCGQLRNALGELNSITPGSFGQPSREGRLASVYRAMAGHLSRYFALTAWKHSFL
jgi:hypothetical protein